jgi:selenocysteine-specific elongation factor
MHVVATAGHVDHGKSTLVRVLTGMEPDRWAEERRRGMTIDLGFAWTTLPAGVDIAFVDVPGHEQFITNMLAGVGAAPAVMLVVAADEGWKPQTEEHLRAVAALGAHSVLLVVSKSDLAPPAEVLEDARERLADRGYPDAAAVAVSAAQGTGIDELRAALDDLVAGLPAASPDAPVRLFVDRAFTINGAGTVVTGTLQAGTVAVGDRLELSTSGESVVVRGLQSMQRDAQSVTAVARIAVNLRGLDRSQVGRGTALLTPSAWTHTATIDVLADAPPDLPGQVVFHVGSAAVPARMRVLVDRALRVTLSRPLPLHLGDRILVRDPATRQVRGATVADLAPQPLRRRGDAQLIGAALTVPASADELVDRRGVCTDTEIITSGLGGAPVEARRAGEHWVSRPRWREVADSVQARVAGDEASGDGVSSTQLAHEQAVPVTLIDAIVADDSTLELTGGRVRRQTVPPDLPPAVDALLAELEKSPFHAPERDELAALGLGERELASACRAQLLIRLTSGVYLRSDAPERAVELLSGLDQPFTVSAARGALGSTRRVVVPLLEHLDAARRTRRLPDGTRHVVPRSA